MSVVIGFSFTKSCPSICDPVDCSLQASSVLHCLPEFAEVHVHWVGDAIQPSHPLSAPFVSCSQSFPASGSFPVRQFFASGDQSIGASTSASVLPINIQGRFPLGWTGWISLPSKGLLRGFSRTTIQKHQSYVWVNVKPQNLQQGRKQRKVLSTPITPLTRENSHTQVTWASPASNILVTLALSSWTK